MHTGRIILNIVFVILLCEPSISSTSLEYQNRGNRYEGVKPKPVSGFDVELISVRVDYTEKVNKMPEQFKLRFYINQLSKIYLTVRELDNKYYYWMDKVRPTELWRPGFDNIFEWPTGDVIQQLGEIKMYDLGIVARLERPEPSKLEKVAPVIFYHSQVPATIPGYLFTFKTNGDTRLTCSVYKEGETEPVFTLPFPIQRGGRPFTVRWDSSQAREGSYKLVLRGYFLDTNDPIDQTVRFYHQPVVQ